MNTFTWVDIYKKLSDALISYYNIHMESSGIELYKQCMSLEYQKDFLRLNPWIKKFKPDWGVESIDPIHIFASFNNWKIPLTKRKAKLQLYYKILTGKDFSDIENAHLDVFPFFPHIQLTKVVTARDNESQKLVWKFFAEIKQKYYSDSLITLFNKILDKSDNDKKVYGIGISSLTIFMFWIDSNRYIPLDKNTFFLLKKSSIIKKQPSKFSEYEYLLTRCKNSSSNLFRNLTHYAIKKDLISTLSEEDKEELLIYLNIKQIRTKEEYDKQFNQEIKASFRDTSSARQQRLKNSSKIPEKIQVTTTLYKRNADVVAEVLKQAKGVCAHCKKPAPFLRKDGIPFLEVHHIEPLAYGGKDIIENAEALCPNCHRKKHFG
jgi:predicted HNH restriction endonuclease